MRALPAKRGFRRSFGGWLALFALGLQLTLSFGHIHAEDLAPAHAASVQSQSAAQNTPDGDRHDRDRNDGDHDGCAICAVMHMAAATLLTAPASVALPAATAFVTTIALDRTSLPPLARQPFQARAPPQA